MKKWEYKAIVIQTPIRSLFTGRKPFSTDPNFKMEELNKLGTEGWEAVNIQGVGKDNSGMIVLLKRELK